MGDDSSDASSDAFVEEYKPSHKSFSKAKKLLCGDEPPVQYAKTVHWKLCIELHVHMAAFHSRMMFLHHVHCKPLGWDVPTSSSDYFRGVIPTIAERHYAFLIKSRLRPKFSKLLDELWASSSESFANSAIRAIGLGFNDSTFEDSDMKRKLHEHFESGKECFIDGAFDIMDKTDVVPIPIPSPSVPDAAHYIDAIAEKVHLVLLDTILLKIHTLENIQLIN